MGDTTGLSPGAFWDASLAIYAKPGVAARCLALQDRWQMDVNLLLFCLHAGRQGHVLTPGELQALDAAAAPWRDNVVRPLRSVRRWLKAHVPALPAPAALPTPADASALREQTQAAEVAAERCQQLAMAQAVPLASGTASCKLAADNLAACASRTAAWPDPALEAALHALAQDAFADGPPASAIRPAAH
jgi:uncharacterized protein (TIGR02444 family)